MQMVIADFKEYVGTLTTKYPNFKFNIDIKGTYTEKGYGSLMIESSPFNEFTKKNAPKEGEEDNPNFLDNIRAKVIAKTAHLGSEHCNQLDIDCGPYLWWSINFSIAGRDAISDFPLDRLDEFVEVVNSVLKPYQPFEG